MERHVWWKYPTRKDPLGRRETVLTATREMMQTIQHRYYVPNNAVLIVTGDVSAAETFALADRLYADWPRGEDPFVKFPLVKHPPLPHSEIVVIEQPVGTMVGVFVWHGPSVVGDDVAATYAADVLGTALSEPSSRFQKDLVDSGACVSASLGWYTQASTGPIQLSFEASPDKIDACVQAVNNELPHLRDAAYLTEQELSEAAHRLAVSLLSGRESSEGLAHDLSFFWATAGLDYDAHYVENTQRVRPADIARYVDRYMLGHPFVFGAMVSPELRKQGFDQAHFEKLLAVEHHPSAADQQVSR